MTKKQIIKMLKELVMELDYDIYGNLFDSPEEPTQAKENIKQLVLIVEKHIGL